MAAAKKKSSSKPPSKSEPKLSDADLVKQTAAAPHASLAGSEHVLETSASPLRITIADGARATLELDSHEPLTQADLQSVAKLVNQAVQETY